MSNRFIPSELRCDCEKKLVTADSPEKDIPANTHRHIHIDEYFIHLADDNAKSLSVNIPSQMDTYFATESEGSKSTPFQPPKPIAGSL